MAGLNQIFVQPLTAVRAPTEQHDAAGTIRREGNKVYKCVIVDPAPTSAAVDIAVGDALGYADYSEHQVCVDVTDLEGKLPAGVALAAVDVSASLGYYIWIQIKGPTVLSTTVANSAGAGDNIALTGTGADDKTFTLLADATDPVAGVLINAGTKEAVLDCVY